MQTYNCEAVRIVKARTTPAMAPTFDTDFEGHRVRRTADGKASVFDLLGVAGATNPRVTFKRLSAAYPDVVTTCYNVKFLRSDGKLNRETPACDEAGWRRILTVLPGVMGAQYREAANQLVDLFTKADIRVAESVVERNDNPADLERLKARVDGKKVRNMFTSTIARHGGSGGPIGAYAQTSIATSVGVTGMRPSDVKLARSVKNARDSFTTEELVRTAYIEQLSSKSMDARNVQGNVEIIDAHREVVDLESRLYRHILRRPA